MDKVQQRIEDAKASSPVDHAAIHGFCLRIAEEETLKSVVSRYFLCVDWRDRWIGQVEVVISSTSDMKLKREASLGVVEQSWHLQASAKLDLGLMTCLLSKLALLLRSL